MKQDWRPRHAGLIVKDIKKAVDYYHKLGFPVVGPEGIARDDDGTERLKVNFVNIGDFQLEFFEPIATGTTQRDFLDKHGEGIQHLAFTVDDIDKEVDELVKEGWELMFRKGAVTGSRIAYFKTGEIGDVLIELVQPAAGGARWLSKQEMHEKVYHLGENPTEKLRSGAVRTLLARNDNVSLWVCDARPGQRFDISASPEEVAFFVLDGCLNFDDGRVVRANEAIFQCPNVPMKGRFVGLEGIRFLVVRVMPLPGATPPSPELMKRTIRLDDMKPIRRPGTGSYAWNIVETESTSVVIAENKPVVEMDDPGHPEAEIVYVLRGKVEYLNGPGRVVRPGECVTNVPMMPHPMRYTGTEPIRIMEMLSPPYGKPRPKVG